MFWKVFTSGRTRTHDERYTRPVFYRLRYQLDISRFRIKRSIGFFGYSILTVNISKITKGTTRKSHKFFVMINWYSVNFDSLDSVVAILSGKSKSLKTTIKVPQSKPNRLQRNSCPYNLSLNISHTIVLKLLSL